VRCRRDLGRGGRARVATYWAAIQAAGGGKKKLQVARHVWQRPATKMAPDRRCDWFLSQFCPTLRPDPPLAAHLAAFSASIITVDDPAR
jgi:hypothetical protein